MPVRKSKVVKGETISSSILPFRYIEFRNPCFYRKFVS